MIIDADGAILGRLSSTVAQKLLAGEAITIVNAEKAVITGRKQDIYTKYRLLRQRGGPHHGPFFPKQPNAILKRTIRGMLPKDARGKKALRNLRVYVGDHGERGEKMKTKKIMSAHMTLGDMAQTIGWTQ